MKRYKKEHDGKLEVGQMLYTRHFTLEIDRRLCKGCELCGLVCPRGAITLVPADDAGGKAVAPLVDVDENKCDFHGICAVVCPFSAIRITTDGKAEFPAVAAKVFPELLRDIKVNAEKCEPGCKRCEETCPLGIVAARADPDGRTRVDIQTELCAGCGICWMECPAGAIEYTKFIEGAIQIDPGACPDGCRRCLDVCPVNALGLDAGGKVFAKDIYCVYCGACVRVCPNGDALRVERTAVRHTPVNSGAWHKGLERLTSTAGLMRELAAENAGKARKAINSLGSIEVSEI